MLLATLTLVLASAFLHAAWNALLKRSLNLEAMTLGILVVALAITGAAVPFVPGPAFPHRIALVWALGSGCCEGLYFLALSRALARASLGWSYTWMRGGSILLVWPLSLLFLGESLRPASGAAVLVVCGGLALMGLAPGRNSGRSGLGWALAVGLAIAGYTLCYKISLGRGSHAIPLFATSMAVSLPVQLLLRATRQGLTRENLFTPQWGLALAGGVLCAASFILYLQSLALGGAGAMATLRNTSVVFALMFSWRQGDRPTGRQWAGALLVAAGAAGLAWPRQEAASGAQSLLDFQPGLLDFRDAVPAHRLPVGAHAPQEGHSGEHGLQVPGVQGVPVLVEVGAHGRHGLRVEPPGVQGLDPPQILEGP